MWTLNDNTGSPVQGLDKVPLETINTYFITNAKDFEYYPDKKSVNEFNYSLTWEWQFEDAHGDLTTEQVDQADTLLGDLVAKSANDYKYSDLLNDVPTDAYNTNINVKVTITVTQID